MTLFWSALLSSGSLAPRARTTARVTATVHFTLVALLWSAAALSQPVASAKTAAPARTESAPAAPSQTAPPEATAPTSPVPAQTTAPTSPIPNAATSQPAAVAPDAVQPLPPAYPTVPPVTNSAEPTATPSAQPAATPAAPASTEAAIEEPPLPASYLERKQQERAAAPAPPVPRHLAPRNSLWLGVRPGVLFPLGALWTDQQPIGNLCCAYADRPFSEFASSGPSVELNAGARLGRHYQIFAFYDYAWLGSGALKDEFGGQEGGETSIYGVGVRFASSPDTWGLIVEMSLGYRTFETTWKNGTSLTASDDLFSTRLGFGLEWRLNHSTTFEALIMLGGGVFSSVDWTFADGTKSSALGYYDTSGSYAPVGLQLAAHWDLLGSKD